MNRKIILAPDSFKGSLSAYEVCQAMEEGILKVDSTIEVVKVPMADGGEGTLESLVQATNGSFESAVVKDPLMRDIVATFGILGDKKTCIIEMASASGICLISEDEKNPMNTTTYGTGQLIKAALDKGLTQFILAIGGSATNDGGAGMLQALGAKLLDKDGAEIPVGGGYLHLISKVDLSELDKRIASATFTIASDVQNPFIGENGASFVFGPQKGATPEIVQLLDNNLTHWANKIEEVTNKKIHYIPGAGAAGGLGGAFLAFFPSELKRGVDIVINYSKLEEKILGADLVLTGEGKIDYQTASGKTPMGVAQIAKKHDIPVVVIAGTVGEKIENLYEIGMDAMFSICNGPISLEVAMKESKKLIAKQTEQIIRLLCLKNKSI